MHVKWPLPNRYILVDRKSVNIPSYKRRKCACAEIGGGQAGEIEQVLACHAHWKL